MESFRADNEEEEYEQNYEEEKTEEHTVFRFPSDHTGTNQNISFHFPNTEATSTNHDEEHGNFQNTTQNNESLNLDYAADDDLEGPTPNSNQNANNAHDNNNPFIFRRPMSEEPNIHGKTNFRGFSRIKDSPDNYTPFNQNGKPPSHYDHDRTPYDHHDMMRNHAGSSDSSDDENPLMHERGPHSDRREMGFGRMGFGGMGFGGMGKPRDNDSSDDEKQSMHERGPHSDRREMGFGRMGFGRMGFGGMRIPRDNDSSDDEPPSMHRKVPHSHDGAGRDGVRFGGMGFGGMGFGGMGFGGMGMRQEKFKFDKSGPRSEPVRQNKQINIIRNFDQKTPEDVILPFYDFM